MEGIRPFGAFGKYEPGAGEAEAAGAAAAVGVAGEGARAPKRNREAEPIEYGAEAKVSRLELAESLFHAAEILLFDNSPASKSMALAKYKNAASIGHAEAALMAGKMLLENDPTPAEINEAEAFFLQARGKTDGEAERLLGDFYAQEVWGKQCGEDAMNYWYDAAIQGDALSHYRLAENYTSGEIVPKNLEDAYEQFLLAAHVGVADAQFELAKLLHYGEGEVEQNFTKARYWYAKAIQGLIGDRKVEAIFYLARMTLLGRGGPADPDEAIRLLKTIDTDEDACDLLAKIYLQGTYGVDRNIQTGVHYLEQAYSMESDWAARELAGLYLNGVGDEFPKNEEKALEIYTDQADKEKEWAYYQAGRYCLLLRKDSPADVSRGIEYLEKVTGDNLIAAKVYIADHYSMKGETQDVPKAIELYRGLLRTSRPNPQQRAHLKVYLASLYLGNHDGITHNKPLGAKLIKEAAAAGNADALLALGVAYSQGTFVPRHTKKAYAAFSRAAELGDVRGIYNKGYCLREGWGVDQDLREGVRLNMIALERGNKKAKCVAGKDFLFGRGVPIDMQRAKGYLQESKQYKGVFFCLGLIARMEGNLAESLRLFKKAHQKFDMRATMRLAKMYRTGNGVEKNIHTAVFYFSRAMIRGNKDAAIAGMEIYLNGEGEIERDPEEAVRWLRDGIRGKY